MLSPASTQNARFIRDALEAHARPRALAKGQYGFRQGQPTRAVFHVLEGEVHLFRVGRQGERVLLHRAYPGDWFAEAALWSSRYHCDAIASRASRLLEVPAPRFREALRGDSLLAEHWIALLSRQLQGARARAERMSLASAEERILHYVATNASAQDGTLEFAGSLKDLAAELGLAHETLYRTLARMQKSGLLERDGKRILVRTRSGA